MRRAEGRTRVPLSGRLQNKNPHADYIRSIVLENELPRDAAVGGGGKGGGNVDSLGKRLLPIIFLESLSKSYE